MPNPNIPLGTLNRLVASVVWPSFPALNVTPSFLGKNGIRFARDGNATVFLPQMVGAVTSNEPYQMITLTLTLIKTQALAQAYERQLQTQSTIGNGVVRPDVTQGIQPFDVTNCAIENVGELSFSGEDAGYPVTIRGYMQINSSLWP